jgi:hypothetical protein
VYRYRHPLVVVMNTTDDLGKRDLTSPSSSTVIVKKMTKPGGSSDAAPMLVRAFTPNLGVSPVAPVPDKCLVHNLVAACFSGGVRRWLRRRPAPTVSDFALPVLG